MNTLGRLPVSTAAALISVALQCVLFAPMLLGPSGTSRSARPSVPLSTAVAWIDPVAAPHNIDPLVVAPTLAKIRPAPMSDPNLQLEAEGADPDDPAVAYALKMGAVTARIQSGWSLPSVKISSDFHCQVRIHQGDTGKVEEVEIESCDEVGSLRLSLVRAIEQAGPLPASDISLRFAVYVQPNGAHRTAVEPATKRVESNRSFN